MLCGEPAELTPRAVKCIPECVQDQERRKYVAKPNPASHLLIPGAALSSKESVAALSLPAVEFNFRGEWVLRG